MRSPVAKARQSTAGAGLPARAAAALLLAGALALAPAVPALAGRADTTAALGACATHYPDSRRIRAAARKAGFNDLGSFAGVGFQQSADGKTLLGTPDSASTSTRCILLEDGLTNRQALAMAEAVVKVMQGASKVGKTASSAISGAWRGMLNNKVANVYVVREFAFGRIRGAVVMLDTQ